jgi:Ala-tRNA(Pro) deacylase
MVASEDDLMRRFADLGIATVTHRHAALFTVEESQRLRGNLPGGHCKSLFLKDKKGALWLVVALEDQVLDLKTLHKTLGAARLSFAKADLLWQVLGVRAGAVTPFALINDGEGRVRVVLDRIMLNHDPLNYHPLHNEATTALAPGDFLVFLRACGCEPRIVELTVS